MAGKSDYLFLALTAFIIKLLDAVTIDTLQAVVSMFCQIIVAGAAAYKVLAESTTLLLKLNIRLSLDIILLVFLNG